MPGARQRVPARRRDPRSHDAQARRPRHAAGAAQDVPALRGRGRHRARRNRRVRDVPVAGRSRLLRQAGLPAQGAMGHVALRRPQRRSCRSRVGPRERSASVSEVPRRIDVELTSDRGDGSWTWRAAGAREPRGVVSSDLVPAGAKAGDVLRAEADFDLDGVTIVGLAPIQEKKRNEPERIELLGKPRRDEDLVTTSLVRGGRGERRERPPRDRGPRDRGPRERDRRRDRDRAEVPEDAERTERRGRRDAGGERPRQPLGDHQARGAGRRPPRPRPQEPPKPKPKRLRPARRHRTAVLEELPPEHRPIAEQVLAGDIPAVRSAIEKENASRKERGEPPINGSELLALAESLRPRLRTAEWRDRADAALADVDEIDLRDLRSVVVAADGAARDDETRALAAQLRDALARRVDTEHANWLTEINTALDEGRAVRALRLSSRPPKAGTILDAALTTRLAEAASASLTADA